MENATGSLTVVGSDRSCLWETKNSAARVCVSL